MTRYIKSKSLPWVRVKVRWETSRFRMVIQEYKFPYYRNTNMRDNSSYIEDVKPKAEKLLQKYYELKSAELAAKKELRKL